MRFRTMAAVSIVEKQPQNSYLFEVFLDKLQVSFKIKVDSSVCQHGTHVAGAPSRAVKFNFQFS